MTTLSAPNMMDLLKLCCNPQEDEMEQYMALTGEDWVIDQVAADLYQKEGLKFVLLDDNEEPVVAGGFDLVSPGVWQTWMVGTPEAWKEHGIAITKHTRKVMDEMLESGHARRIQTMALASREHACKWYEKGLKMTFESLARNFGVNGEDVACYVRLKENRDVH